MKTLEDLKLICDGVKSSKTIEYLALRGLGGNKMNGFVKFQDFQNDGCALLRDMLKVNKSLKPLDLTYNI